MGSTPGDDYNRESVLYLGWWNTGLSPPGRSLTTASEPSLDVAGQVVRDLVEINSLDLLGLGEVTASQVEELRRTCAPTLGLATVIDRQEAEKGRRRIGAVYNPLRLKLVNHDFKMAVYEGRDVAAGLFLEFLISATHTPLFVILLICTVIIVGALTFIPALALGPIVEHLQLTE